MDAIPVAGLEHPGFGLAGVTASQAQLERWTLALEATGVRFRLQPGEQEVEVWVPEAAVARARALLGDVEAEHRAAPPPRPQPLPAWPGARLVSALLALGLVVASVGAFEDPARMARGVMDARAVLGGQWGRLVTAAALHADTSHLLGNLVFLLVVGPPALGLLGPGVGLLAFLGTAVVGGLTTALLHGPGYLSVGASGGLFGLLGALTMISARTRRSRVGARRYLVALGAGAGLLAMLAFGPRADVVAHLGGFVAGCVVGLVARLRREGGLPGWLLQGLAAGVTLLAFAVAFRRP